MLHSDCCKVTIELSAHAVATIRVFLEYNVVMYLMRIYQFASPIATSVLSSNVNSYNSSIKNSLNAEFACLCVRTPHFLSLEKIQ